MANVKIQYHEDQYTVFSDYADAEGYAAVSDPEDGGEAFLGSHVEDGETVDDSTELHKLDMETGRIMSGSAAELNLLG